MNLAIWAGRCVFAVIWLIIIAGLLMPMAANSKWLLVFLLVVLLIMHGLLLAIFVAVYRQQITWRRGDYWQILLFGIIGWLALLRRPPPA